MKPLLLLLSLAILSSCSTSRIPGSYAHVSISPAYSTGKTLTIGVLPVTIDGKPDQQADGMVADKLSARFLDLGFRVIDRSRIEASARNLGIDLTKPVSQPDIKRLSMDLNVDAYLAGSQSFNYIPAHSESHSDVIQTTHYEIHKTTGRDGKPRNDTTWVHDETPTTQHSSVEGQYVPIGESVKIVAAQDGEVLISGYVGSGPFDMTDEIVDAIHEHFWPTKHD
jgi:hypothetical protein